MTWRKALLFCSFCLLGCSYGSDGKPNSLMECRDGSSRACGTNVGTCTIGEQSCVGGIWGPCSGAQPRVEICDDLDNDCDGDIDEAFNVGSECTLPTGCPGIRVCRHPTPTITMGEAGAAGADGDDAGTSDGTVCAIDPSRADAERCAGLGDECRDGSSRACGKALGTCTIGEQTCVGGIWSPCSGNPPSVEICDYLDNDCDGDIDEAFDVGSECTLAAGCPGKRVCRHLPRTTMGEGGATGDDAATSDGTVCEIDESRRGPELCDGLDNDCDGIPDYTLTKDGLIAACACVRKSLTVATPADLSVKDPNHDDPNQRLLCDPSAVLPSARSRCGNDATPSMTFCLSCAHGYPYTLCESTATVDLSTFDGPSATGALLEVVYTFTSETPAKTPINLWYQAADRKRLPLIRPGDAAGSYHKFFLQKNACLPETNHFGAAGACVAELSGTKCQDCSTAESCGSFGTGCVATDFSVTKLQLAAEFCPSDVEETAGRVDIQQIDLLSPGCLQPQP